jgi:hypothetical protein
MSTKSKEWQEFKRVREDILSEFTTSDAGAIRKKWAKDCLEPLGYNHEFDMLRCKERSEEDKAALYAEWTQMFKDGKFSPSKRTATKKKTKPKRGSSLDDLTLDEPKDDSPDLKHDPSFTKEALEELGDEPATQPEPTTKQPKIIDKLNKKNVDAMKKHKEELTMAASTPKQKSKKELLLELLEEENTGITEEKVEEISRRVAVKVFSDLFSEVSEVVASTLSSYLEDTKNQ